MKSQRIQWLDLAKGVTIFLVVVVHVIEGLYKTGQFPQQQIISTSIMGILFTIVMPIFFALSGFVYTPSKNARQYVVSLGKKLVNLGIPYVIFSIIYVALQHASTAVHHLNSWQDLAKIYAVPIGYLWYLYVLFFVYVLVGLLSLLRVPMFIQLVIYGTFLLISVCHLTQMPYILDSLMMWTSSFYLGYIFRQRPSLFDNQVTFGLSEILFIVGLLWQVHQGGQWFATDMMTATDVWAKIASIPVFLFLFQKNSGGKAADYLTRCGQYSLIIYLVHAPMASIVRVLLIRMGVKQYFVLVLMILIFAWGASLMVVYFTTKWRWLAIVFNPMTFVNQLRSGKRDLTNG